MGPGLFANLEHILNTNSHEKCCSLALAFEESVGSNRGARSYESRPQSALLKQHTKTAAQSDVLITYERP